MINDYGRQDGNGLWTSTEFRIRAGATFRALGAGQSPRGSRNEQLRPDVILVDDIVRMRIVAIRKSSRSVGNGSNRPCIRQDPHRIHCW